MSLTDSLDARLARFASTRDPAELWPGLSEAARVAAAREIARLTGIVLRSHVALDGEPHLDREGRHDSYALAIAAHTTGMGPVLGRWLEDGRIAAHERHRASLAAHLDHSRRRVARLRAGVLPAIDALLARGIPVTALKGYHTGSAYFDEPGARRMSDVDVMIPAECMQDAGVAIAQAGFSLASPALVPHKLEWIAAGVDARTHSVEVSDECTGWTLETHTSLDRRYAEGTWAHLDAISRTRPCELDGRRLRALDPASLLISLACHCSEELEASRLLRLFEIIQVIRIETDAGALAWDDVFDRLCSARAMRFVYPAFSLVEQLAPGTIDARIMNASLKDSTWFAKHTVSRLVPGGGRIDDRGLMRQFMWTSGSAALARRLSHRFSPANTIPGDARPGWRAHLRRLASGALSLRAPDERP
ncbi:MAG: nucleotidyltransferase family protein [Gemmatimonadaceae bacterium]